MINRFKEMVDAGVASFRHQPAASETPTLDPLVLTYNIYWGRPTGSHMDVVDGKYIITGNMFDREPELANGQWQWGRFLRGTDVKDSGYYNLIDFLHQNGKDIKKVKRNGSTALELIDYEENCICTGNTCCPDVPYTTALIDSVIPKPLKILEKIPGTINKIKEESENMGDFIKKLNECVDLVGGFMMMGGNLWCITRDQKADMNGCFEVV